MPDEHLKELLLRIEASLKEEITALKRDVNEFQDRAVTRDEHQLAVQHIYKELERMECRVDKSHDQWKDELAALKQDLEDSRTKIIAVTELIVTVV